MGPDTETDAASPYAVDSEGGSVPGTSATGGTADKRGYRYEMRWTVLNGVVPVLVGTADWITIEPPGEAGEGVEFRVGSAGADEAHQAKRQRTKSNWTMNALVDERVVDRLGVHLQDPGTSAVFASGTPAPELDGLAHKARQGDVALWRADLTADEIKAANKLEETWNVGDDEAVRRLSRIKVATVSETVLAEQVGMVLGLLVEGDDIAAYELLEGFVVDNLHRPLRSDELWSFLHDHGHPPRDAARDSVLSERLRELVDRYLAGIEASRPRRLRHVERPEVEQVLAALTAEGPRRPVAVVGPAGSGKSTVVADVVTRLRQTGAVVAALRLDLFPDPAPTADALGAQPAAALGGSPARVLQRAAAGASAVLVVDQLDALSAASGRAELTLEGVRQTLLQAGVVENVRILVACREHDLEHDWRLRQLLAVGTDPEASAGERATLRVPVGELDDRQINELLSELGVGLADLQPRLRSLLRNAFNLSLLARLVEDSEVRTGTIDLAVLRTRLDLLRAVDEHFARRLRSGLGITDFGALVQGLAREMSEKGALSLPAPTLLSTQTPVRNALLAEGVLVADGGRIRFFHQAYFEYAFAQAQVASGRTAMDLLDDDLQDLLRRGQVRSILALERDADLATYDSDAHRLLFDRDVRTHIRSVVVDLVGNQLEPSGAEVALLRDVASTPNHSVRFRATRALSRPGIARALAASGLLDRIGRDVHDLLKDPEGRASRAWLDLEVGEQLWLLENLARTCPEEVARALRPTASDAYIAASVTANLLRVAFLSDAGADGETIGLLADLLTTLTQVVDALPDEELPERLGSALSRIYSLDGNHALHTLALRDPSGAVDVLAAWFRLATAAAARGGGTHAFQGGRVLPHSIGGLNTLALIVDAAPRKFVETFTSPLLAVMEAAKFSEAGPASALYGDSVWPHGSPYLPENLADELRDALVRALRQLTRSDAASARPFIEQLSETNLATAQVTAAAALAEAPPELLGLALTWAARPDSRRPGWAGTAGWSWGSVLAHVVTLGAEEEREQATELVLAPYRDLDLDAAQRAVFGGPQHELDEWIRADEQHTAAGLVQRAWVELGMGIPEELAIRVEQLSFLGPVPETPGPIFRGYHDPQAAEVAIMRSLTDEEWLAAMAAPATLEPDDKATELRIDDHPHELRDRAQAEPSRFARFLTMLPTPSKERFAGPILFGISQSSEDNFGDAHDDVFAALRSVWLLPERPLKEVCLVIQRLSKRPLPDDIVAMLTWIATNAEDPASEVWLETTSTRDRFYGGDIVSAGMNSTRGQALIAATQLAGGASGQRYASRLADVLARIIDNEPMQEVRVLVPDAIACLVPHDRASAVTLLGRWLARSSDQGLAAPNLVALAYCVGLHEPNLANEIAERMIGASPASVRSAGGTLAAYLAWRSQQPGRSHPAAMQLFTQALADADARAGVAFAAAELRDSLEDDLAEVEGDNRIGWSLLIRLLDDREEQVRSNAGRFAHRFEGSLDPYERLLAAAAATEHFHEIAGALFFAVQGHRGEAPLALIALAERWLSEHGPEAGDPTTSASLDARNLAEIVLDVHSGTPPDSDLRSRCLDIFDRLIELGSDEVEPALDMAHE